MEAELLKTCDHTVPTEPVKDAGPLKNKLAEKKVTYSVLQIIFLEEKLNLELLSSLSILDTHAAE